MKADKARLSCLLGDDSLIFDEASSLLVYSMDQGEVPAPLKESLIPDTRPDIVVQPGNAEDLQKTIRFAAEKGIPLVPRGASTFGMGGAVPHQGGILLDFSPRREIYDFDPEKGTIRTGAGCRWSDVSPFLNSRGFELYSYPTSWFSTTAGWASTGGLGIGCTSSGSFHDRVNSMTVVMPSGELRILDRSSDEILNFLGTEGQMGAIWDLTFSVRKKPALQLPVLIACDSVPDAMDLAKKILSQFKPYHMKFLSRSRIHEVNHLLREEHPSLKSGIEIPEADTLLLCFEESRDVDVLRRWAQSQQLAVVADFRAHYLWRERMSPLRVKRIAPGLLASEVILPLQKAAEYAIAAEQLGENFNVSLSVEAYFLPDQTALMLPVYTFRGAGRIDQALKSALSFVLTNIGIAMGGRPYGTGIWNTPFVSARFGSFMNTLSSYKNGVDPCRVFNPGKFFDLKFRSGALGALASRTLKRPMIRMWAPLLSLIAPVLTAKVPHEKSANGIILENEELCSKCGSCIAVCPAYIETKDERTTARGKLQLGKRILTGGQISSEEADVLSLCMHCGACTDVCQSRLDLVPVWDELESQVQKRYGRNVERIGAFVKSVEQKKIMEVPYARGAKVLASSSARRA